MYNAMTFIIFTRLCTHNYRLILEHFYQPLKKVIGNHSSFPQRKHAFCLDVFVYSRHPIIVS